jgi:hypothetical protein
MPVDVKKVANRRPVRYNTLDEFVRDAERLAQVDVRTLGNRSYTQILGHLAFAMNGSIDGSVLRIPWHLRTVARLLRKRILSRGLTPGFQLSRDNDAKAWVEAPLEIEKALEGVRKAVGRLQSETKRSPHPALGALSTDEWNTFHLRHSELHMSFVVPA